MSGFVYDISLPKNTLPTVPFIMRATITVQRLVRVEVMFPDGCVGIVGCAIQEREVPIIPLNGGWVRGNNETVAFVVDHRFSGPPWQFSLKAYNLDDTNTHTLQIRFTIIPDL